MCNTVSLSWKPNCCWLLIFCSLILGSGYFTGLWESRKWYHEEDTSWSLTWQTCEWKVRTQTDSSTFIIIIIWFALPLLTLHCCFLPFSDWLLWLMDRSVLSRYYHVQHSHSLCCWYYAFLKLKRKSHYACKKVAWWQKYKENSLASFCFLLFLGYHCYLHLDSFSCVFKI